MNDKKIIMIDCNSVTSYGELYLMNYEVEFFGLKDGIEIIAYEGEDVWNATIHYNPLAETHEQWWVELGDYIDTLTEKELKWEQIGFYNGRCSGAVSKEIEIDRKLIDYGMPVAEIQKILKISEKRLYCIKFGDLYAKFRDKIVADGWTFEPQYRDVELSENSVLRKCNDKAFRMFFNYVRKAESADGSAWFLCASDYENNDNQDGFSWNEFEKMSFESAESDGEKEKIKKWWERHLPVAMSVSGEYKFLAIDLENGSIVQGYEPDFEDTETVAGNFEELIKMIIAGEFTWFNKDINYFRIAVDETPEKVIYIMSKKYDMKKYSEKAYFIDGNIAEIYINEDYDKKLTDSEDGWLYYNTNMDFFPTDKKITGLSEKELAENIKSFFDSMGLKSEIISEEH